jgi:hypothetical protein
MTVGEILLAFTGAVVGLLLVAAGTSFYRHDYRYGVGIFLVALVLGVVFFRKRKLALVISSLSPILALGILGFPFHPSLAALVLLLACAVALYLAVRWSYENYPYLSYRNIHTLFQGEAAMTAENARIAAQARQQAKNHPSGPWLFR